MAEGVKFIPKRKMVALGLDKSELHSFIQHIQTSNIISENVNPFSEVVKRLQVKTRFRKPYGTDKYDTAPSERWLFERGLPWTLVRWLNFSPIIGNIVYIIDRSTNFWKYNLTTKEWTELTSPTYNLDVDGIVERSLALSPDGTKLACIGEGTANHRGGRRIEIYTIASDTWAASGQVQNMDDENTTSRATVIAGLVWADEATIWAWAAQATAGVKDYARCIKYSLGGVFTIFATLLNGNLVHSSPQSAAINAAGTIIYGSVIGATDQEWYKYTIATDTYTSGGTLTSGRAFAFATDRDKLWYFNTTTVRQGYINTVDDAENDNVFPENTDRDAGYGRYFGVKDDLSRITAHARAAAPELMSVVAVTFIPRIMMF